MGTKAGLSVEQLRAVTEVFLAAGFHAAAVEDLERATGEPWESLLALFGDKEGLFFAATEAALTAEQPLGDADSRAAIVAMLQALKATSSSTRLRVIHKAALQRLLTMAEASS